MTQSKNILGLGQTKNALNYFPSLYSCNDTKYQKRFSKFIRPESLKDEVTLNKDFRLIFRREQQDKRDRYNQNNPNSNPRRGGPEKLADHYGLPYDTELGVIGY